MDFLDHELPSFSSPLLSAHKRLRAHPQELQPPEGRQQQSIFDGTGSFDLGAFPEVLNMLVVVLHG
jgi:hypothetical protein